jgi:flagellar operon protein
MNQRFHIGPPPIRPITTPAPAAPQVARPQTGPAFADVLRQVQEQGTLKFSAHAQQRLEQAHRTLTPAELAQVANAVDRAAAKGARESLILMRDLALVVSVTNRTVITAVDEARMKENIFTNIDSAVIL